MKLSVLVYKLDHVFLRLKTLLYYRLFFKKLGSRSVLSKPLLLYNTERVMVGKNVLIRKGLRMEVLDRPDGRLASILIGDNVNIEQNCHVICQNKITIGKNVSITGGCAIVDTTHPYSVDNGKTGSIVEFNDDEVNIGDNVFIGYGSIILPGTSIGSHSYIGAMSVVKGKFPERSLVYGSPAKLVKTISKA